MNILKLKSIVFSLMAIAMVTVFLSSCEKDSINLQPESSTELPKNEIQPKVEEYIKSQGQISITLPSAMKDADQNSMNSFLANMTVSQLIEREESYRIESFLRSLNRLDKVSEDLGHYDLLTIDNLKKYVSDKELANFRTYDTNAQIKSRWCQTLYAVCIGNLMYRHEYCCSWGGCSNKYTYSWGC